MKQKYKILVWLLPVGVAVMIFLFSAQPGDDSSQLSSGLIRRIVSLLAGVVRDMDADRMMDVLSVPVRKGAHVTEYLGFYISLLIAMFVSGLRRTRVFPLALAITFLYACTDEFHQLFVPGRAGMFQDVLIDCCGAGVLCLILFLKKVLRFLAHCDRV